MNERYILLASLLLVLVTQAANEFSVGIDSMNTKRGFFEGNNIYISNCNEPQKPQYVTFSMRIEYPSDECSGAMDVYYSYYDFALQEYVAGESQCVITSQDNCDIKINMMFGGLGSDTKTNSEWIRFRGVCRKTGKEYTYNMPVIITHSETNIEREILARLTSSEQSIRDASAALSACKCCESGNYALDINNYNNRLQALKKRLTNCDFDGLSNQIIALGEDAKATKKSIEAVVCPPPTKQEEVTVEPTQGSIGGEVITEPQQDSTTKNKAKADEKPVESAQPQQGMCPAGAIILALLCGLFVAVRRA